MRFGVLIVSDSCSKDISKDKSGTLLKEWLLNTQNVECVLQDVVPDEVDSIQSKIKEWVDEGGLSEELKGMSLEAGKGGNVGGVDVVFTVGGTGCAPRDVTPEATLPLLHRELRGMSAAMTIQSLKSTPLAMLSRAVCGTRYKSLIINLPGSSTGALECAAVVYPTLQHCIELLRNDLDAVVVTHQHLSIDPHAKGDASLSSPHSHSSSHSHSPHHHGNHHHKHHHHHHHQRHHSRTSESHSSKVDNKVAHRNRSSTYPIITVEEALEVVLREVTGNPVESVPYDKCLHRILSSDIQSECNVPPFPASIKDGYAVIASDGAGKRRVLGHSQAGAATASCLEGGECVRVSTGAMLPGGADAVVMVEDTLLVEEEEGGREEEVVDILVAPTVGQDIRPVGSDIKVGEVILTKGLKMTASEIGLIASTGNISVDCHTRPSVGVMSTGNELMEPESDLVGSRVRDSNRVMLRMSLQQLPLCISHLDLGVASDVATDLLTHFLSALEMVDVIITTGGVSMGEKDLVKDVLVQDLGATIHFARVFMKPGKPTTFATLMHGGRKKFFFGLPGNPVSAMVTFKLFVVPFLRKMSGSVEPSNTAIQAKLTHQVVLDARPEYHRCHLTWHADTGVVMATSTGKQISSRLMSMTSAAGLLKLPAAVEGGLDVLQEGSLVECVLLEQ